MTVRTMAIIIKTEKKRIATTTTIIQRVLYPGQKFNTAEARGDRKRRRSQCRGLFIHATGLSDGQI